MATSSRFPYGNLEEVNLRPSGYAPGDDVVFTDIEGTEFHYTFVELEDIAGTAAEEMESGIWDLTLFPCTLGGQARVTVR